MKYKPSMFAIIMKKLLFIFFRKAIYKEFAFRLPLNGDEKVLDFGSGIGEIAFYVANRLPYGHLICINSSSKMLKIAKKNLRRFLRVTFLQGDLTNISLPKESFDLIYCDYVMHLISNAELKVILAEVTNLLKPKGLFAFREPFKDLKKHCFIQNLLEELGLLKKDSRITDIPILGNTLESIYIKL